MALWQGFWQPGPVIPMVLALHGVRAQVESAKIPNAPTPTTEMSSWAFWAAAAGHF